MRALPPLRLPLCLLVPIALALLAGCSGPPAATAPGEGSAPPAADVQVHELHGDSVAMLRPGGVPERPVLAFGTGPGVQAIVVELAWDDGPQDLDSFLRADVEHCPTGESPLSQAFNRTACAVEDAYFEYPGFGAYRNSEGGLGEPDNPSRFIVAGEELAAVLAQCSDPCRWESWAEARDPAAAVGWSLYVSVFRGGGVPLDYTAIPE